MQRPMKGGSLWKAAMRVAAADAEALSAALEEDALAISALLDAEAGFMRFETFHAERPSEPLFEEAAARAGTALRGLSIEQVPETDWVAHSLANRPPIRAGRFFVTPPEHLSAAAPGSIPLIIAATQGFGTGSHPSTRGCLTALSALAKHRRFLHPLDLGCGSGVLSFAMARLFARPVLGLDIDPTSVLSARENARANALHPRTRFAVADGLAGKAPAQFDLIAANILAGPLARFAQRIARALAPKGMLILSGLLSEQEVYVRSAYQGQGLFLQRRIMIEGWTTLILARGSLFSLPAGPRF